MAISTVNIGSAPNDGTGDPLRTAFNKLNTNFLNITADGGDEITVTDPTTSTDATLNNALQNIFAGATPDLQEVVTQGGVVISSDGLKKVEIDKDNGQIKISTRTTTSDAWILQTEYGQNINTKNAIFDIGDLDLDNLGIKVRLDNDEGSVNVFNNSFGFFNVIKNSGITFTNQSTGNGVLISPSYIEVKPNGIDPIQYPLPTGASSPLATLADITASTPDLQAVTDVGNSITDGVDVIEISASGIFANDGVDFLELQKIQLNITNFSQSATLTKDGLEVSSSDGYATNIISSRISLNEGINQTDLLIDKITVNSVDYPLPTGASSQIATLADITASTPDLQAVTDVDNTITDGVDTNTISASGVSINDGVSYAVLNKYGVQFNDIISGEQTAINSSEFFLYNGTDETIYQLDKIQVNGRDYPLPTGASSPLATLADITGGVTDGDKGDITVSSGGTVWSIDNGVVSDAKIASGIDATKIADGSVNNTEFQYINSLTSNAQTQLNNRVITLLNDNVTTSAVTGTTANTIIKSYLIPANTLAIGDTLDFKTVVSKTGTNGAATFRVYTNTANSLTGANALGLMSFAASTLYYSLDRTYTLKSDNTLQCYNVATPNVTDESNVTGAISNVAFDRTVDNYLIIAVQPANGSDSFVQTLCYLMQMKAKTSI